MALAILTAVAMTAGIAAIGQADASDQAAAGAPAPVIGFDVYRKGERIGRHEIAFERSGDGLRVTVDIDLSVSFLFFTAYSYRHRVETLWREGRLVELFATTDDDGREQDVRAEAVQQGLEVTPAAGEPYLAPATALPTTYWHPVTPQADALLNTQTGELMEVSVRLVEEGVMRRTPWGEVKVDEYLVDGPRDWSLWYDEAGCLAGIGFSTERGTPIEYRLTDFPQPQAHAWLADTAALSRYTACAVGDAGTGAQASASLEEGAK